VLRFNFRGVGGSSGRWSDGEGEINDVAAAVAAARARHPGLRQGIAGWSFGAATSLRWMSRDGAALPWVGIAPPVASSLTPPLPGPAQLKPAPRTFILGDRDQFIGVDELRVYSDSVGGTLHILGGSDHFFYFREERVGGLVASALCEACTVPEEESEPTQSP
jgi:alpha/beta superfamily hydrolase